MLDHNTFGRSIFHSFLRLAGAGALLAATGCAVASAPAAPVVALTGGPIAAGASASLPIGSTTSIDHATSSDPSVLTVTSALYENVSVTAGKPGTATITAYDASNNVLGTNTAEVALTNAIALDPGVTDGITVLVGHAFGVHATALGLDGAALVGTGAIHFASSSPQGAIVSSSDLSACYLGGDCAGFAFSAPGDATITMTTPSATTTLTLHAVASVDTLTFPVPNVDIPLATSAADWSPTPVPYTVYAGGAVVWTQARCGSPSGETAVALTGPSGAELGTVYGALDLAGTAVGSAVLYCTPGGASATLTVNVR